MSVKRNLPGWMMVASDHKSGKEERIRESLKRKPEVDTKKCVRKKCTKRMMYWMNERELVETALSVLSRDKGELAKMVYQFDCSDLVGPAGPLSKALNSQLLSCINEMNTAGEDRRAPLTTEMTVIPETDHEETTDSEVSEPAVDIVHQETVPYNECLEARRCSSVSERSDEQGLVSSVVLEKEDESEEQNHEALQVLREIFFS